MALRPYQSDIITKVRAALSRHKNVMMQLPTGGGKTRIFSEMTKLAAEKKNSVWIMVPRNELLRQASGQLSSMKISHGMISAKHKESRAYSVHVISKDTILRRIKAGKIKNWPRVIICDEAHLALDQQLFIRESAPEETVFIGTTATPEKLDGRGLDELYDEIIYGPTIKELVELNFLSNMKYFSVPGFDIEALQGKDYTGTDVKADVLDQILKTRQIYGNAIAHYRKHAHNKACIVFCRSVKAAEETAERFRDAGYRFESIDGRMTDKQREALISGVATGRLHGLTSCELVCYGLDIPKVECIIMLRPTLSRALFCQMIGRGLRPLDGKEHCVILDHVALISEHGHPMQDYEWKFHGEEKRGRKKGIDPASLKLCSECFLYFVGNQCPNCGTERGKKPPKKYEEIDGRLIEIIGPVKLNDRPPEEKREFQDKYSELMESITGADTDELMDKYVKELLKLAADAGLNAMSVYWRLSQGMRAVNVPVLHSIRRTKSYAPGWVYMQKKVVEKKLGR